MTEAEMKETMDRTRQALVRHLGDLMDEVDMHDGRITSRKLLGGIHEAVDAVSKLGNGKDAGEAVRTTVAPVAERART
jgi:formate-dependent nitrite reductase cytochrome c552 subunit